MTYDEVIKGIQDKTLQDSFYGIFFRVKDNFFGFYEISSPDLEDLEEYPEHIPILFEGSHLFDYVGEEDFYDLDDVPEEAKHLVYFSESFYPVQDKIRFVTSEFALFSLFPTLPNPENVYSPQELQQFIKSVKEHFLKNADKFTLLS